MPLCGVNAPGHMLIMCSATLTFGCVSDRSKMSDGSVGIGVSFLRDPLSYIVSAGVVFCPMLSTTQITQMRAAATPRVRRMAKIVRRRSD